MGRFTIPANCVSGAVNFLGAWVPFSKKKKSFGGEDPVLLYELLVFFFFLGRTSSMRKWDQKEICNFMVFVFVRLLCVLKVAFY